MPSFPRLVLNCGAAEIEIVEETRAAFYLQVVECIEVPGMVLRYRDGRRLLYIANRYLMRRALRQMIGVLRKESFSG